MHKEVISSSKENKVTRTESCKPRSASPLGTTQPAFPETAGDKSHPSYCHSERRCIVTQGLDQASVEK